MDHGAELCYLIGPLPSPEDLLPPRTRRLDWAALLKRVFSIDVLSCPRCGDRLRLIAAISEPSVVSKILEHLQLPTTLPQPACARAPPWAEAELDFDFASDSDPDRDLDPALDRDRDLDPHLDMDRDLSSDHLPA